MKPYRKLCTALLSFPAYQISKLKEYCTVMSQHTCNVPSHFQTTKQALYYVPCLCLNQWMSVSFVHIQKRARNWFEWANSLKSLGNFIKTFPLHIMFCKYIIILTFYFLQLCILLLFYNFLNHLICSMGKQCRLWTLAFILAIMPASFWWY